MGSKKHIIVSVSNDLSFDQRVHKVCTSLHNAGYNILLVGRIRKKSVPLERVYRIRRFKYIPERGVFFYAVFNIRLFIFLMFKKVDVLHANDLDTLLANWMAKLFRRKHLVYDTHEYFTGVPEIQNKPIVKKTWTAIEKMIFPKLNYVFTVNDSIANLYEKEYGIKIKVLRNFPVATPLIKSKSKRELGLPNDKKIVILQGGGINVDRGSEELLEAIALSDELFLCIVGDGDVIEVLKKRSCEKDLKDKLMFTGLLPYNEMMQYTMNANVGVSLDKDTNINHKFSLPNKIFDYLKAGIPVVVSDLKEVATIVKQYKIGKVIPNHLPKSILNSILEVIENTSLYEIQAAQKKLIWKNEEPVLLALYEELVKK
jgi:glycosyltransferase involved in cell wall biosynthesis